MRFSHWLALIVIFMIMISLPAFVSSDISSKAKQENLKYTSYAKSATKAAMAIATQDSTSGLVFSNELTRKRCVDAYYETLIKCFSYEFSTYKDLVKYYTPCIFLVDNDGYYIEYTATYNSGGYDTVADVISTINKWSAKYDDYYVEFHLDETVSVVYDKSITTGDYQDVYKKLGEPAALRTTEYDERPSFADNRNAYHQKKQEYLIGITQEKLEYYINSHSEFFNQFGNQQYAFTLPKITGDDWGRMLDMPTVIGFLQGKETEYDGELFNVYAFTGHELTEEAMYYIIKNRDTGEMHYHTKKHLEKMGRLTEDYKGYSMEGAAKAGASPCPTCILKRY